MKGRTGEEPTFWEFVQSIIRDGKFLQDLTEDSPSFLKGINDRHWNPIHLQCNLCHTRFHFILTLETLARDEEDLFSSLNISSKVSHLHSNRYKKSSIFDVNNSQYIGVQSNSFSGIQLKSIRFVIITQLKTSVIMSDSRISCDCITDNSAEQTYLNYRQFIKRISFSSVTNLLIYSEYYPRLI